MSSERQSERWRIFICYRLASSATAATAIRQSLATSFGNERLFHDVTGIGPGDRLPRVLEEALAETRVMVVVIGPGWLTAADDEGNRRLSKPGDWVAHELETGLTTPEIDVIPLPVEGAVAPTLDKLEELPPGIHDLAQIRATPIRTEAWDHDIQPVLDRISGLLGLPQISNDYESWRSFPANREAGGAARVETAATSSVRERLGTNARPAALLVAIALVFVAVAASQAWRTRGSSENDAGSANLAAEATTQWRSPTNRRRQPSRHRQPSRSRRGTHQRFPNRPNRRQLHRRQLHRRRRADPTRKSKP